MNFVCQEIFNLSIILALPEGIGYLEKSLSLPIYA